MEIVDNEIRDEIMEEIILKKSNQSCFDCGSHLPRWSSPYLGILLCIECAGRHRGYGTHISFIKSIDLDKWNKKQLKSLELTGNLYAKKLFEDYGIPKIDSIYDYNSNKIMEIRKEIENLVKEKLKPTDYMHKKNKENKTIEKEEGNINTKYNLDNKENEENLLKPIKFEIKNNKKDKDEKKGKEDKKIHKRNKIKKIDIDFNFDDYEEIPNDKTKNDEKNKEEEKVNTKKISGMKISRKDKKRILIEEQNKKKTTENNQKKKCCEKIKEYIYKVFSFFNSKTS